LRFQLRALPRPAPLKLPHHPEMTAHCRYLISRLLTDRESVSPWRRGIRQFRSSISERRWPWKLLLWLIVNNRHRQGCLMLIKRAFQECPGLTGHSVGCSFATRLGHFLPFGLCPEGVAQSRLNYVAHRLRGNEWSSCSRRLEGYFLGLLRLSRM
jgi:hypothetical protein